MNQTSETFTEDLTELIKKLNPTVCLECVAGKLTGDIMNMMPKQSVVVNYGLLSEENIGGISPLALIGKGSRLEGFLLPIWLREKGLWGASRAIKESKKLLKDTNV